MKPSRHIIASALLSGVLWFFTKSFFAAGLCFVSGVLIDVDHVIEYIIHYGARGLNLKKVYKACEDMRFNRLYLVFHTAELGILLWAATVLTQNIYLLALASGYSLHLILDIVGNQVHPLYYFFILRLLHKFHTERLTKGGRG